MKLESSIRPEATTQIRSDVYCDNTQSHLQALPLGGRIIGLDLYHKPINLQPLIDDARDHLRASPECGKEFISCLGDKNGTAIPIPIRHLL